MRLVLSGALVLLLMLSSTASAAAAPIPATTAFRLPSVKRCVNAGTLDLRVRELRQGQWASATVTVDGKRVKRVTRPRPARAIRVRDLPLVPFELKLSARTNDRRTATVTRTYHPCAPGGKPVVTVPPGTPPTTLVTRDIVVGTGAPARRGRTATTEYVLVTWSNGKEADSSWPPSRGSFTFPLGRDMVIEGFDRGVAGMRVGGRREFVVPPALGYGEQGAGEIAGGETLVFVVDLIAVDEPA